MSDVADTPVPERGYFIALEGGDGCGKSTQAAMLAQRIGARSTREPGGTRVGERIRSVVLDPDLPEMTDRTEALLMAADRAQHVAELVEPALARGEHVVTDRYVSSSLVYQGVGRGLGIESVKELNDFGTGGLFPDLVVLLDIDVATSHERLGHDLDRIESSGQTLADLVRATYHRFAESDPQRWATVDATGDIDTVAERVAAVVRSRLGLQ